MWGSSSYVGTQILGSPTDAGYASVFSTYLAFAALKADGVLAAWGDSVYGGSGATFTSLWSRSGESRVRRYAEQHACSA